MNIDDFHTRLNELYVPHKNVFSTIDVPEIRYAMIDGEGDPQGPDIAIAIKWLFSIAHLVKPLVNKRMGKTFGNAPIEFLHWTNEKESLATVAKDHWKWRAMMVFIDWITQEDVDEAVAVLSKKLGPAPATLRLDNFHEGKSVQLLHIGDYSAIRSICDGLYSSYLPNNGFVTNGYYHEIYLNDPSRVAPQKRKTVIRQPVKDGD